MRSAIAAAASFLLPGYKDGCSNQVAKHSCWAAQQGVTVASTALGGKVNKNASGPNMLSKRLYTRMVCGLGI